jgi:geranylgeranyl diphosphate synthase type II
MNSIMNSFNRYAKSFEKYLETSYVQRKEGAPEKLYEAMEYSLTAGGKRLRPVLCLASAERCGCKNEDAMPLALGFEMLHTATLIHDDLPCMDNDDMRRGMLSNHAKYGETMAVLAGDALLAQSVEYPLTYSKNIPPHKLLRAIQIFTNALGPSGVCGGQVLDMDTSQAANDKNYVRKVAALKTGVLIRAAVTAGAALGTDDENVLSAYYDYGTHLGSAFQIVDDILDVTSTAEELGKTPGKDLEQGKINHVSVFGLEGAREIADTESKLAKKALAGILEEEDFLELLPEYLVNRTK